ncbi:MAG: hypothetical protein M3Z85_07130 [Acidobacteriota bacterium]|nr:hypothetical protein [Acidobacteriota bacterium]
MQLTAEEKMRIYLEEKERIAARRLLGKPYTDIEWKVKYLYRIRPSILVLALAVAIIPLLLALAGCNAQQQTPARPTQQRVDRHKEAAAINDFWGGFDDAQRAHWKGEKQGQKKKPAR